MRKRSMAIELAAVFENLPGSGDDPALTRRDNKQLVDPQTVFVDLYEEAHRRPQPKMSSFEPEVETFVTPTPSIFNVVATQFAFNDSPWLSSDTSGLGIISYADVFARWSEGPLITTLEKDGATYEAIGLSNVEMYRVQLGGGGANDWLEDPLVRVRLVNQTSLWLMMIRPPASETDMACCAFTLTGTRCSLQKTSDFGEQVILPTVRLEYSPDISWMHGLGQDKQGGWYIEQAQQRIRLVLSEEGSDILREAPAAEPSEKLVIDRGFMAFFTSDEEENGINAIRTPLFMSYLDTDSWERMS